MKNIQATTVRSGRITLRSIAATGTVIAVLGLSASPSGAQDIQELKRQIETLQKRIEQLERAPAPPVQAPAEAIRPGPEKGSFFIPGTNTAFKFGGIVSADLQADLAGDSGPTFSAGSIPLDSDATSRSNEHLRLTAQNSRFNFTVLNPTDFKPPVKGFFELDFQGDTTGSETVTNSHEPRLRHAYVEFPVSDSGKLLVGQTWTTAMGLATAAPSLGFGGTSGGLFVRQPQIRYTHDVGDGITGMLALENPELSLGNDPGKSVVSGSGSINPNDIIPDLIGRVDWKAPWGPVEAGMINQLLNIDRQGFDDTEWGWGLFANTAVALPLDNTLYFQSAYGDGGLGRYLDGGFASGYLVNNDIETSEQWALKLGLGHRFTPALRANIMGGYEQNDVPAGFTGDPNQHHWSAHANVLWQPMAEKVPGLQLGIEYQHGERRTARTDSEGTADRIHFQTLYSF